MGRKEAGSSHLTDRNSLIFEDRVNLVGGGLRIGYPRVQSLVMGDILNYKDVA